MKRIFIVSLSWLFFSSCYSYHVTTKKYRHYVYNGPKENAFVLNPELEEEYKILQHSGIFNIVADSSRENVVKVKLYSRGHSMGHGYLVVVFMFTLGQCPASVPDNFYYEFEEIRGRYTTNRRYLLPLHTRLWFWDIFSRRKDFEENAGQALQGVYHNE